MSPASALPWRRQFDSLTSCPRWGQQGQGEGKPVPAVEELCYIGWNERLEPARFWVPQTAKVGLGEGLSAASDKGKRHYHQGHGEYERPC